MLIRAALPALLVLSAPVGDGRGTAQEDVKGPDRHLLSLGATLGFADT